MQNLVKYIITAILQGALAGFIQYVFQEVDQVLGAALLLTPLSLINIGSITNDKLPDYLLSFIYSSLYSLSIAILFYILLTKTGNSRTESHRIILITVGITIFTYILYNKKYI